MKSEAELQDQLPDMDAKTLKIRYISWAGHNFVAKALRWEASFEGDVEVFDWGTKQQHIGTAISNGWAWKVVRTHRDGSESVIQSGKSKIKNHE